MLSGHCCAYCIAICFQSMSVLAKHVPKQFFFVFWTSVANKVYALWLIGLYYFGDPILIKIYCWDQTQKIIGCVTKHSQFCSANMDSYKILKEIVILQNVCFCISTISNFSIYECKCNKQQICIWFTIFTSLWLFYQTFCKWFREFVKKH